MNSQSIRFRLVAWYAGVLLVVFIMIGCLMFGGLKLYLEQSLGEVQRRRAVQIADTLLANPGQTGEAHVVAEINSWFTPETNDRFIRITRADGTVLYVSSNPRDLSFDASEVPPYHQSAATGSQRVQRLSPRSELLIASVLCGKPDGQHYLVEVGASTRPIREVLQRLILLLLFSLAAGVIVSISGGYFLVRKALTPVGRIANSAKQITRHNLKERLSVAQTGDELEHLSVSLNHMIERLEDALQHNQRFIADASHELRTPLTIIRGELEQIVKKSSQTPDVQRTAVSVLDEVTRLSRIVEGLFSVSKLDAGEAQKEWARFDLANLATSTAEQMCLLAEDKEIKISANAPHEVFVDGDSARLKQVVVNLLDNAIKYTPAKGNIRLSVTAAQSKAILEVEDDGIGIPAEAGSHIFERFFRVDKARSRELGGAGLGLAIVKSICAAHGGVVDFRSTEGKGSSFKVELPLASARTPKREQAN